MHQLKSNSVNLGLGANIASPRHHLALQMQRMQPNHLARMQPSTDNASPSLSGTPAGPEQGKSRWGAKTREEEARAQAQATRTAQGKERKAQQRSGAPLPSPSHSCDKETLGSAPHNWTLHEKTLQRAVLRDTLVSRGNSYMLAKFAQKLLRGGAWHFTAVVHSPPDPTAGRLTTYVPARARDARGRRPDPLCPSHPDRSMSLGWLLAASYLPSDGFGFTLGRGSDSGGYWGLDHRWAWGGGHEKCMGE
mmetsp:Transcript_69209/g.218969  ORF Transcript_69209/g.218969 Transcript_69209/m.218969 type:complete len:249 (+) Transcript_69209:261-1007(+)